MEIEILSFDFAVCKVKNLDSVYLQKEFCFTAKTDNEILLVCKENDAPTDAISCEKGWRAFRICGTLDFSLVGILAKISTLLAENGISIFALSTFDTDYVLLKRNNLEKAVNVLKNNNYIVK